MVISFVLAGLWLRFGDIEGYVMTSSLDPAGLPDPLAKTVVRSADGWWQNYETHPFIWLLPLLGISTALLASMLVCKGHTLSAFVASSVSILGVIGTTGAAMFPFIMPSSTQPNASLTVWDSVSSHLTLQIMFYATLIFMPLIIYYTSWAYHLMRGKVTVAEIQANSHQAY